MITVLTGSESESYIACRITRVPGAGASTMPFPTCFCCSIRGRVGQERFHGESSLSDASRRCRPKMWEYSSHHLYARGHLKAAKPQPELFRKDLT